jgi:hypothetical protein
MEKHDLQVKLNKEWKKLSLPISILGEGCIIGDLELFNQTSRLYSAEVVS